VVYELAVADLAGTYLADFELVVLPVALTPDERVAYETDLRAFREVQARFQEMAPGAGFDELVRAAGRTPQGRAALAAFRRIRKLLALTRAKGETLAALLERHRESRTLVFTADNDAAYAIARRHLIMPLTCDIQRPERANALARFRGGELRALISARVLNEGLDVPDADVGIIVGGTLGVREHVQRVGRVLRPSAGKRALVYELVARGTIEVGQGRRRREGLGARNAAAV
jgi:superfamily II DNA or RNA helicase